MPDGNPYAKNLIYHFSDGVSEVTIFWSVYPSWVGMAVSQKLYV